MGFSLQWRKRLLASAMTGYRRVLHREEQGYTKRNRLGKDTALGRRVRKLCGNSSWFKTKKSEPEEVDSNNMRRKGTRPVRPRVPENICETAFFFPSQ